MRLPEAFFAGEKELGSFFCLTIPAVSGNHPTTFRRNVGAGRGKGRSLK